MIGRPNRKRATCHTDRESCTRAGLCSTCYQREHRARLMSQTTEKRREYRDRWRAKNPESYERKKQYDRERNQEPHRRVLHWRLMLKRDYGITEAEYQTLYAAQGGLCAICRGPQPHGVRLAVDHDHATGAVRGLLCNTCNQVVGYVEKRAAAISAAHAYLRARGKVVAIALG